MREVSFWIGLRTDKQTHLPVSTCSVNMRCLHGVRRAPHSSQTLSRADAAYASNAERYGREMRSMR